MRRATVRLALVFAALTVAVGVTACGGSMTYSVTASQGGITSQVTDSRSGEHTAWIVLPDPPEELKPPNGESFALLTALSVSDGEAKTTNQGTVPVSPANTPMRSTTARAA